jgi:hypothetical protein
MSRVARMAGKYVSEDEFVPRRTRVDRRRTRRVERQDWRRTAEQFTY